MPKSPKMTIHIVKNTSRSKMPQWYAKSTLERNLKAKASSKKPKETLTVFSQPPDLGISLSHDGNTANIMNGMARATEKPSMPTAGPISAPSDTASTNRYPMIGPVQENETSARVKAIKNRPIKPPRLDFSSILLTKREGNVISNAPRKEMANTMIIRKNAKLNQALLAASLSADAPKTKVT